MMPARIQTAPNIVDGMPSLMSLLALSLLSAALFSATFVLNYAMFLDGGSWVWSAVLRYGFAIVLLVFILHLVKGRRYMAEVFRVFRRHALFWMVAGTFACGLFYAGITFAADHLRGWVVAGVLLLSMGSVPFWILLTLVAAPPPPGAGQVTQTFLVALLAGVAATSIF